MMVERLDPFGSESSHPEARKNFLTSHFAEWYSRPTNQFRTESSLCAEGVETNETKTGDEEVEFGINRFGRR